jgi:hypothetical protein
MSVVETDYNSVTVTPGKYPMVTVVPGGDDAPTVTSQFAPRTAAPVFTVEDLGKNHQLTYYEANGCSWEFAAQSMFVVHLYDSTLPTQVSTIPAEDFVASAVSNLTATTFRITYTFAPLTTTVVIDGSVNTTTGALTLTHTCAMDTVLTPTYFIWAFEIRLKLKPYEGAGSKSDMTVMFPAYGGLMYRDATTVLADVPTADYPGMHDGGIFPEVVMAPFAGHQQVTCWHKSLRKSMSMRLKGTDGRGERFTYNGDGSSCQFGFYTFPADHLQATTDNSSPGLELCPMNGDWYDSAKYYRERIVAEAADFVSRGKIKDGALPVSRRDADMMLIANVGEAGTGQLSETAAYARAVEEFSRIVDFFGSDLKYIVQWYAWRQEGNDLFPDFTPKMNLADAITNVDGLGNVTQAIYVFPSVADRDSTFAGAGSFGDWVLLGPTQDEQITTGTVDSQHVLMEFGAAAFRTTWLNVYAALTAEVAAELMGLYIDTVSGNQAGGDYRLALAGSNRGPGANYYNAGKRSLISAIRTEYRTTQGLANWLLLGEWQDEYMMPYIDSQGASSSLEPLSYVPLMPAYATVYSEYVGRYGYDESFYGYYADGAAGTYTTASLSRWDINAWRVAYQFHAGALLGVWWHGWGNVLYLISEAGDGLSSHSSVYSTYHLPMLNFMKACVRSLTTLSVRKYHRGQRLRPLVGSQDDILADEGYQFSSGEVVSGGVTGTVVEPEVMSSVWLSTETGMGIGIVLTNYHTDDRTFTVSMTPERWPDMVGRQFLCENDNGTRTLVKQVSGSFSEEITVPAGSVVLYELLATEP